MKKRIAFFGDSFCGGFEGWVESFCKKKDFECVHIGKKGADPYYVIKSWVDFNQNNNNIDYCIYFHTEGSRIYHPSRDYGLTTGVVEGVFNGTYNHNLSKEDPVLIAAKAFNDHLNFPEINDIKNIVCSAGADQLIKQTNKAFSKIVHFWSFAPIRRGGGVVRDVEWTVPITSGTNVILDMCNLSSVEPGYTPHLFDQRALHFSKEAEPFLFDLVDTAINVDGEIDFRPYITKKSKWTDYINAFEKIKLSKNVSV